MGPQITRLAAVARLQTRSNLRIAFRYRADFLVGNFGTMIQAFAGVIAYLFLFDAQAKSAVGTRVSGR